MPRIHDRGGWPDDGPIDRSEHEYTMWEKRTDAMMRLLTGKRRMTVDELRRGIESLEPNAYESMTYYERWIASIEMLMIEKGVLTKEEIDARVAEME